MFKTITWGQYFTTILVVALIYYLVIAVRYYRKELMQLLQGRIKTTRNNVFKKEKESGEAQFNNAEKLKAVLQTVFVQAAEKRWVREELQTGLQSVLKDFHGFKGTAFQVGINNYISGELKSRWKIELSDAELHQLW